MSLFNKRELEEERKWNLLRQKKIEELELEVKTLKEWRSADARKNVEVARFILGWRDIYKERSKIGKDIEKLEQRRERINEIERIAVKDGGVLKAREKLEEYKGVGESQ